MTKQFEMGVISIEQDEEYNALVEKLEGLISKAEQNTKGKKDLDKQLIQVEYSLQKIFNNGKFNKAKFLESKLQEL